MMSDTKKLEEYSFGEIVDMSKEDFESALKVSDMNIGSVESMRKFLSLQYEVLKKQMEALSDLMKDPKTEPDKKEEADKCMKNIFLLMMSMEYKATLLYNKSQKLKLELN